MFYACSERIFEGAGSNRHAVIVAAVNNKGLRLNASL